MKTASASPEPDVPMQQDQSAGGDRHSISLQLMQGLGPWYLGHAVLLLLLTQPQPPPPNTINTLASAPQLHPPGRAPIRARDL